MFLEDESMESDLVLVLVVEAVHCDVCRTALVCSRGEVLDEPIMGQVTLGSWVLVPVGSAEGVGQEDLILI